MYLRLLDGDALKGITNSLFPIVNLGTFLMEMRSMLRQCYMLQ